VPYLKIKRSRTWIYRSHGNMAQKFPQLAVKFITASDGFCWTSP